jgi:hypothetical protein
VRSHPAQRFQRIRPGLTRLNRKPVRIAAAAFVVAALVATAPGQAGSATTSKGRLNCYFSSSLCTEIANPQQFWGSWYVGHDEPSLLFYSSHPGAGNRMQYQLTIPTEPAGPYSTDKTYNFELQPAFWFGVAVCDTQSFPETVSTCTPDSDANAVGNANPKHPGTAYEELQFYPPGWVPQFANESCSPTQWCVALNIDSLSENGVNGKTLNPSCQAQLLGGLEYVNFAYLTLNGKPQGPPNPLDFNPVTSGQPGPNALYLNPGDQVSVTLHDTANGLATVVHDATTGQTGSMVASAKNGFGQIQFAPRGNSCTEIPYNFHAEYSTTTPDTTVPWTAHSYNVAFSGEIGHFQFCSSIDANTDACNGIEGRGSSKQPADGDDTGCFAGVESLLYPATGCVGANTPGFDGPSYQRDWPSGSSSRPGPLELSSPLTGAGYNINYTQAAFENDLPRVEASDFGGDCNRVTGQNCVDPPNTEQGVPANFYPYYTTVSTSAGCRWSLGTALPNTTNNFGGEAAEYGSLYFVSFLNGNHGTETKTDTFHNTLPDNPCPA